MGQIATIATLICILVCCYTDVRYRLIKNIITMPMMLGGVLIHALWGGWPGVANSLLGMFAGLCVSGLFGIAGGIGAGDIKLFGGIGAILGAVFVLENILLAFLVAIPYSFFISPRRFLKSMRSVWLFFKVTVLTKRLPKIKEENAELFSIPFAICIGCGFLGAYLSKGGIFLCLIG